VPDWRHYGVVIGAAALHVVLVWSVICQVPDAHVPPTSTRFLTGPLFFDAVSWPGPGGDFFALYHGGLQARRGGSPHDLTTVEGDAPYYFRYIYSHALAQTLGRVVTLLNPRSAYLVWVGVVEASLLAWLLLLYRDQAAPSVRTFALVLLLAGQPYLLELHMGQFTFVAVALTLWAAKRGLRASGGAALFAAIVLKTFPLVVLPALIRTGARRVLIGGLVAAAVVLASSVVGPRGNGHIALGMVDTMGGPHPGAESLSQAIYVIVLALSGIWIPTVIPWLPAAVVSVSAALTAWHVFSGRASVMLGCCAMLLAFFVAYQHVWEHHYSAVLLICVVALVEMSRSAARDDTSRRALAVAAILLALPSPFVLAGHAFQSWTAVTWLLMSVSKGLPTAVAFAAVLRALSQDRAAGFVRVPATTR
jgi:hypothetical protein